MLEDIRILRFRNLDEVELGLQPGVNWVVGTNAAGKTALLEAVYCLSRGRSFRGKRFGGLVAQGARSAQVEARVVTELGRERLVWSSDPAHQTTENAAERFPVRLICEWTHCLVDGEPALRRRFVDWNLRLWNPRVGKLFSQFRRVTAQRNAWLRDGARGRPVWDRAYAESLAALSQLRAAFFRDLSTAFESVARESDWFLDVRPMWEGLEADGEEVGDRLREMRDRDRERGYTYLGASRADYSFRVDAERWVGSRGQAKVVGTLLQVAADRVVRAQGSRAPVWLLDDLDAELAPDWARRLLGVVRENAGQLVVTSLTGKSSLDRSLAEGDEVFHVEHGRISSGGAEGQGD